MPARTASSTTYWMAGLSTIGSISLGWALVAGRKRVPRPAAGMTALVTAGLTGAVLDMASTVGGLGSAGLGHPALPGARAQVAGFRPGGADQAGAGMLGTLMARVPEMCRRLAPSVAHHPAGGSEMPTYEYRCKDCGEELEVVQSFTDDPLDTCPSCGGQPEEGVRLRRHQLQGLGLLQDRQPRHHQDRGQDATSSTGSSRARDRRRSSESSTSASGSSSSDDAEQRRRPTARRPRRKQRRPDRPAPARRCPHDRRSRDRRLRRFGPLRPARRRHRGRRRHPLRRAAAARCTSARADGRRVAFLPRHGADHAFPPHRINYRANLWAMRELGVTRILAPCASGSLQPDVTPGRLRGVRPAGRPHLRPGPDVLRRARRQPRLVRRPLLRRAAGRRGGGRAGRGHHRARRRARWSWSRARASRPGPSRAGTATPGWEVINMTQYPEAYLARELGICYAADRPDHRLRRRRRGRRRHRGRHPGGGLRLLRAQRRPGARPALPGHRRGAGRAGVLLRRRAQRDDPAAAAAVVFVARRRPRSRPPSSAVLCSASPTGLTSPADPRGVQECRAMGDLGRLDRAVSRARCRSGGGPAGGDDRGPARPAGWWPCCWPSPPPRSWPARVAGRPTRWRGSAGGDRWPSPATTSNRVTSSSAGDVTVGATARRGHPPGSHGRRRGRADGHGHRRWPARW